MNANIIGNIVGSGGLVKQPCKTDLLAFQTGKIVEVDNKYYFEDKIGTVTAPVRRGRGYLFDGVAYIDTGLNSTEYTYNNGTTDVTDTTTADGKIQLSNGTKMYNLRIGGQVYPCNEETDTTVYSWTDTTNLTIVNATLANFHTIIPKADNPANTQGYAIDAVTGAIKPVAKAVEGDTVYNGRVKLNSEIVNSWCAKFDGVITLSHPNLTGVTIDSYLGTATPSISGNTINVTAGYLYYLKLSDGSEYTIAEGDSNKIYDRVNGNHLTVVGATLATFWSPTSPYSHNINNGFDLWGASSSSVPTLAWWKLDEVSGTTVVDSKPSGTLYNGTNNGATVGVAGHDGTAYQFTASEKDYLNMGNMPVSGDITVSMWVKLTSNGSYQGLLKKDKCVNLIMNQSGSLSWGDQSYWSTDDFGYHPTIDIFNGQWHLITVTKEGSLVTIYQNADVVVSKVFGTSIVSNNNDLLLGTYLPTWANLNGLMDDVRLYNTALSAQDIASIYNEGAKLRVPFKTDGSSILTDGDTLTGYTWISRNTAGSFHNGAESGVKMPLAPELINADTSNYYFDSSSNAIVKYADDFISTPVVADYIFINVYNPIQIKSWLMYSQDITGSCLAKTLKFTKNN